MPSASSIPNTPAKPAFSVPPQTKLPGHYVNEVRIRYDESTPAKDCEAGSKESVWARNQRLASTAPFEVVLEEASKALEDFETKDPLGTVLKGGLPKKILGVDNQDIQLIQKSLVS